MSFWKEAYELVKELGLAFLEFWVSIFKDLHSFRNKLVLISTLLCLYVIWSSQSDTVIVTALGIWNIIIAYYFKKRNESFEKELEVKLEKGASE